MRKLINKIKDAYKKDAERSRQKWAPHFALSPVSKKIREHPSLSIRWCAVAGLLWIFGQRMLQDYFGGIEYIFLYFSIVWITAFIEVKIKPAWLRNLQAWIVYHITRKFTAVKRMKHWRRRIKYTVVFFSLAFTIISLLTIIRFIAPIFLLTVESINNYYFGKFIALDIFMGYFASVMLLSGFSVLSVIGNVLAAIFHTVSRRLSARNPLVFMAKSPRQALLDIASDLGIILIQNMLLFAIFELLTNLTVGATITVGLGASSGVAFLVMLGSAILSTKYPIIWGTIFRKTMHNKGNSSNNHA